MPRRLALILAPLLCLLQAVPASADQGVCRQFIDTMLNRVSAIVHDQNMGYARKHEKLEALFEEAVDMPWVAQRVAGQYWQNASPAQRQEYLKAYRRFLSGYYIGSIDQDDMNDMQSVTLQAFANSPAGGYEAQIRLDQKNADSNIIYLSLAQDPAGCRIHDFTVEGVSLLVSQTDEINSLGVSGGLPHITQQLLAHPGQQANSTQH